MQRLQKRLAQQIDYIDMVSGWRDGLIQRMRAYILTKTSIVNHVLIDLLPCMSCRC